MPPERMGRVDPMTGNRIDAAEAALRVLEATGRRTVLAHLVDNPRSTRRDIATATGQASAMLSRALNDLMKLGYVTMEESTDHGRPDYFTAHRSVFVSDLTTLRDRFAG